MVLPPVEKTKFTKDFPKLRICVTGAGGFIASHLARRLKAEGHFVRAVDWKENEYMPTETFCDEFVNLDLRWPENCEKAVQGFDWCFNLAVRAHPRQTHTHTLTDADTCTYTSVHRGAASGPGPRLTAPGMPPTHLTPPVRAACTRPARPARPRRPLALRILMFWTQTDTSGLTLVSVPRPCCRPTWAAWASSSPTTRASSSTRR